MTTQAKIFAGVAVLLVVVVGLSLSLRNGDGSPSGYSSAGSSGSQTLEDSVLNYVGSAADGAEVNSCWTLDGIYVTDDATGDQLPVYQCSVKWGHSAGVSDSFEKRCFDRDSYGSINEVSGGVCDDR